MAERLGLGGFARGCIGGLLEWGIANCNGKKLRRRETFFGLGMPERTSIFLMISPGALLKS